METVSWDIFRMRTDPCMRRQDCAYKALHKQQLSDVAPLIFQGSPIVELPEILSPHTNQRNQRENSGKSYDGQIALRVA